MRILLTNNTLGPRAGSECYLRDVALRLRRRGHDPIAYSRVLGDVADELRRATIPVVDDLGKLGSPPDVIHGQHHLETMTAALRFPQVPVISFCHGWLPWEEMPARAPNVVRYVAVDETCRDRLVSEEGIAPRTIDLVYNFVDLERFEQGPELPRRPRRALVFSNQASERSYLPVLREACARHGLTLDAIGSGTAPSASPEDVLPRYDIVFAKARAALEAMAVGRAVVLCDQVGLGEMVTSASFDGHRRRNFGIRSLSKRLSVDAVLAELERYDADDAARVSARIRSEASLDDTMLALEGIYERAAAAGPTIVVDAGAVGEAASAYLARVGDVFKRSQSVERDLALRPSLESERDSLRARCAALESERDQLEAALRGERDSAHQREVALRATQAALAEAQARVDAVVNGTAMRLRDAALRTPLVGRAVQRVVRLVSRRNEQPRRRE